MKKLYYIVRIEPREHLDPVDDFADIVEGVVVSYDEALQFYEMALIEFDDDGNQAMNYEKRMAEAARLRDAGERLISDGTGCGVAPEYLTDKEYFQRRLEGLQTLEEFRKGCE